MVILHMVVMHLLVSFIFSRVGSTPNTGSAQETFRTAMVVVGVFGSMPVMPAAVSPTATFDSRGVPGPGWEVWVFAYLNTDLTPHVNYRIELAHLPGTRPLCTSVRYNGGPWHGFWVDIPAGPHGRLFDIWFDYDGRERALRHWQKNTTLFPELPGQWARCGFTHKGKDYLNRVILAKFFWAYTMPVDEVAVQVE